MSARRAKTACIHQIPPQYAAPPQNPCSTPTGWITLAKRRTRARQTEKMASPSSATTYKYKHTDLATDAIRLVYLGRGCFTDPVECRLFETWLHEVEGVPYEALSYH